MIARPESSFTSRVDDCDGTITVQLGLENPIWGIERLLHRRTLHRRDELRQGLFRHDQTETPSAARKSRAAPVRNVPPNRNIRYYETRGLV